MTMHRRDVLKTMLVTPPLLLFGGRAFAASAPVYTTNGVALNGTDVVGYVKSAKAIIGVPEHSVDWQGATWLFASANNKQAFAANPTRFAPAYGGYCAYAIAFNGLAKTNADAWTIYENRLYLNRSKLVRALWQRDIPKYIERADKNWPSVLG